MVRVVILLILLAALGAASAPAQQPRAVQPGTPQSYQLKETEITGRLKEVLGSMKLLETEIVGTVERPRLGYSIPWRDPDPLMFEEGELESGFLKGIYAPVDRETFSREIRSEGLP